MTRRLSETGIRPYLPLLLGVAALTTFMLYLTWNWGYYGLPPDERLFDARHHELRSSGSKGLSYGVVGTGMIVLSLGYLLRKRLGDSPWLGSLRSWMRLHVLTGLVGPALILLHTTLVSTSALGGLAATALLIVVATGIVGRYIYTHVPRSYRGRELELEEVRQRLARDKQKLQALGVDPVELGIEEDTLPSSREGGAVLPALIHLVTGDWKRRRCLRLLEHHHQRESRPAPEQAAVLGLLRRLCRERQWLVRYHEVRGLMRSWRFLHRWLAIVLFLAVTLHILLAVWFGDLWTLKRG